jgi:hypothetical protein
VGVAQSGEEQIEGLADLLLFLLHRVEEIGARQVLDVFVRPVVVIFVISSRGLGRVVWCRVCVWRGVCVRVCVCVCVCRVCVYQ